MVAVGACMVGPGCCGLGLWWRDRRHAVYLRSLSFSRFFLVPKKEELGWGSIAGGFAPLSRHGLRGMGVKVGIK